jgi:hypothetical protein
VRPTGRIDGGITGGNLRHTEAWNMAKIRIVDAIRQLAQIARAICSCEYEERFNALLIRSLAVGDRRDAI